MMFQKYISIIVLIFTTSISFGQKQLLKKYDFDKGGYYLLGIHSASDRNGLADSLGEFYTDDPKILSAIKEEWIFKKPGMNYACGYHYIILICKDGLELERFSINLNCHEIVSDMGSFYFDPQKLRMFKDDFKWVLTQRKTFTLVSDARNYRDSVLRDTNLIMTPTPTWTKFEGSFYFTYDILKRNYDFEDEDDKLLAKLTEEIKLKYPEEQFELENAGGSSSELTVLVNCNKSLSDKFSLYRRIIYDKWKPFDLYFCTYWKISERLNKKIKGWK